MSKDSPMKNRYSTLGDSQESIVRNLPFEDQSPQPKPVFKSSLSSLQQSNFRLSLSKSPLALEKAAKESKKPGIQPYKKGQCSVE